MTEKTLPCPACNKELITPREYFPALQKMREQVLEYREVLIADYKTELKQKSAQGFVNIDDEKPSQGLRDPGQKNKNTFPLLVCDPNCSDSRKKYEIALYNYGCGKIFAVDIKGMMGCRELPQHKLWMLIPR